MNTDFTLLLYTTITTVFTLNYGQFFRNVNFDQNQ